MIRKSATARVDIKDNMRGGKGEIRLEHLLEQSELYEKGRLFSRVTIPVGGSVGYHIHEKEMEAYYILKGTGEYDDNGVMCEVSAGDTTLTVAGESHGIENNGAEPLELIALIIFE
jgi:mannose-6-phosphate isomerase-like protein (cupin superfamily)